MGTRPVIVAYDPTWPDRFEQVVGEVRTELDDGRVGVHHVGSTAVPGCGAKDVVDVLVTVPASTTTAEVVPALEALGFVHEPSYRTNLPERWFLRRSGRFRTHVHVEPTALPGAVRDCRLVFRDALRADPSLRDAYVQLKHRLAAEHDDTDAYAAAKGEFVFGVLERAARAGDRCGVHVRAEHPDHPDARLMVDQYGEHVAATIAGFTFDSDAPPPEGAFERPLGTFLVAYDSTEPIGCVAVWRMLPHVAEIRRMWLVTSHRGGGIGRRLLAAAESAAVALGCDEAWLDSNTALSAAVAMYRSAGYSDIDDYNRNPNADVWLARRLTATT